MQVHLLNYLIKYFNAMDYWTSNYNTTVIDNTKKQITDKLTSGRFSVSP